MHRATRLVSSLLIAILAGCSGGYGGPTQVGGPPPDPNTVTATAALAFTPATLTVNAGDAVTFAFQSVGHNVFFDAQTGAPANIDGSNANISLRRTFATAGTYHYTCHIHPEMHGTIVVQ